jgi:O-antigen ligase
VSTAAAVNRVKPMVAGVLAALFLLVGRMNVTRIAGTEAGAGELLGELRLWVVLPLLVFAFPNGKDRLTRASWQLFLAFAFLYGYLLLTALWAPDAELAGVKAYELVLVFAVLSSVLRIVDGRGGDVALDWFWLATIVITAALALVGLAGSAGSDDRLAVLGGGPNVFARLMGLLVMACFRFWKRGHAGWLFLGASVVPAVLAILSGSRGGLVALAVAIAFFFLMEVQRLGRIVLASAIVIAISGATLSFTDFGRRSLEVYDARVEVLLLEKGDTSGRDELYESAMELGRKNSVLGAGLAAFPANGLGPYPHNLFLEVFCEAGLLGVLVLIVPLAVGVLRMWRQRQKIDRAAAAAWVFILVASQFSGDLFDSRGVFELLILAVAARAAGPGSPTQKRTDRLRQPPPVSEDRRIAGLEARGTRVARAGSRWGMA